MHFPPQPLDIQGDIFNLHLLSLGSLCSELLLGRVGDLLGPQNLNTQLWYFLPV